MPRSSIERLPRQRKKLDEEPVLSAEELYQRDVADKPTLSPDEERALMVRIRAGDDDAFETFFRANVRLVMSLANRYKDRKTDYLDLVSVGNICLREIIPGYEPETYNTRFSTYATVHLDRAMIDYIRENADVPVPPDSTSLVRKWDVRRKKLEHEKKRPVTDGEVRTSLGLPVGKYRRLFLALQAMGRLATPPTKGNRTPDDIIHEKREEDAADADEIEQLHAALETLDEREKIVIARRFGLDGQAPMTLDEIGAGALLGKKMTRQAVLPMEQKAIQKLADALVGRDPHDPSPERLLYILEKSEELKKEKYYAQKLKAFLYEQNFPRELFDSWDGRKEEVTALVERRAKKRERRNAG